jgi:hypothetical protein
MKRIVLWVSIFCSVSLADEVSAYKYGWIDGFRTGYALKNAKSVDIPAGYWLYLPTDNLSTPLVGFYVFTAQRLGLKAYLTEREVVFGVFERRADAELYREQLLGKGVEGVRLDYRNGTVGYEGSVLVIDKAGAEQKGVSGLVYYLQKAIEKAREIDPTVLNTTLLIEDLKKIMSEVSKWKSGQKGYERVIPDERERGDGAGGEQKKPEIVDKFLKER